MIIDKLSNAGIYNFKNLNIKKALEYLINTDFPSIEDGKYHIDADSIISIINTYETKNSSESYLEAHKKYIDVQYVIEGIEFVGYLPLNGQTVFKDYDDENDYMLFNENCSYIKFSKGMFAIFFPQDLHKPGINYNSISKVKKAVIKVKI